MKNRFWILSVIIVAADAFCVSACTISSGFVSWQTNTISVINRPVADGGSWSPRIVKLSNGDWLCAYDSTPSISTTPTEVYVRKSIDQGQTWTLLAQVTNETYAAATPELQVLQNGTILCAYRIGVPGDNHFEIKIVKSTNNGMTWQYLSTVVTNTQGVWEPDLLLKSNGELLLFYANDDNATGYDQCIDVRSSMDSGATWSSRRLVCGNTASRDGMPVPVLLDNGEILVVFEGVFSASYPYTGRYTINSTRSIDGGQTWGPRTVAFDPGYPHGANAPFIVQIPSSGEVFLSCQTDEVGSGNYMRMAVAGSCDRGQTWVRQANPFIFASGAGSYWNSLFVYDSQHLVAATSTWDSGFNDVQLIKGDFSTRQPIGYWKLDGNANDSSINSNNGSVVGNVHWTAGINGQAADFNGILEPQYIRIDNSNLYKLNEFTISCWIQVQQWGPDLFNQYVALHNDTSGWGLSRELNTSHSCMLLRGPTQGSVSGIKTVDDNQWHHVAATWSGSTGMLRLYFDGWLENSSTNSGSINYNWEGTIPLVIGGRIYSDPIEAPLWLAGRVKVDDVRIYDYALNLNEVGHLYNAFTGSSYCTEYPQADFDKDCKVTLKDFAILAQNWTSCNLVPDCY